MICSEMFDDLAPEADHATDWARPLYQRQIAVVGELAEMGLELTRAVTDQVKRAGTDPQDAAMAYARVARAVRLTLMLQVRLIGDLQAFERHQAWLAQSTLRQAESEREDLADERKARTMQIVERIAGGQHDDLEAVERLVEEASERLDQDDLYGDILSRPVSELVAMICEDLDLSPDWPRLAEEAWAREEVLSGQVGRPLAGLSPAGGSYTPIPPPTGEERGTRSDLRDRYG
jgi:hypothetical protein